ncbi:hypothetical protein GE09DRAFT_1223184 [Coniochaeta sp. 2T2.1]|nr:hypothetical protein GE09DRAFT_1223184 [Coniochaeta sp. 2T2.1]
MSLARPYQAPGSLCYLKYDPIFEHEKPFSVRFPFNSKLKHDDFNDFRDKQEVYTKEIEDFLKRKMGFAFVEVYDLLIRRRTSQFPAAQFQEKHIQPIRAVHVGDVWKPLNGPVRDWPLAVCDYRSCSTDDIVDVDQVYPDAIGEGCNIYFNPKHRWYFVSDQMPHEALLLKQMDSRSDAADCEL